MSVTSDALIAHVGSREWSRETRRNIYASYRSFFGYVMPDDSPASELPPVKPDEGLPRPCPGGVLEEALAAADSRTRLILLLGVRLGLRRCEIAAVHGDHLVRDLCGWSLEVHGKGGKVRLLPVPTSMVHELRARLEALGGGYLFPGPLGHLLPRRVGELASAALPGNWTLHTLRHGFATQVYERSRDILAVSQLLGHSSVGVTQRYVAVDRSRLREVMEETLL